jgi:RNA polymerase sigma factor (TIGR02999 family)
VQHGFEAMIQRADHADSEAVDELFAILYHELRRLAEHKLRSVGSSMTLGTTTLLHEAYLNIAERENIAFPDRSRFLAYASRAMRGLVIDYARSRRARKRGRQFEISLVGDETPSDEWTRNGAELEQLSDALDQLAEVDAALAELVDMHFFCGFSFGEIAELRKVSERTVYRDWRQARLLLRHALLPD